MNSQHNAGSCVVISQLKRDQSLRPGHPSMLPFEAIGCKLPIESVATFLGLFEGFGLFSGLFRCWAVLSFGHKHICSFSVVAPRKLVLRLFSRVPLRPLSSRSSKLREALSSDFWANGKGPFGKLSDSQKNKLPISQDVLLVHSCSWIHLVGSVLRLILLGCLSEKPLNP